MKNLLAISILLSSILSFGQTISLLDATKVVDKGINRDNNYNMIYMVIVLLLVAVAMYIIFKNKSDMDEE